jgi:hypothetical protein
MARHSHPLLLATAVLLAFLLSSTAPVAAQPSSSLARYKPTKPDALVHFEAGNKAYKDARITSRPLSERVRDLKRAIDEYTAGQALDDAPAFDYNIAHAARLLVDNPTAVAHLQRFVGRAQQLDEQLRRAVDNEIAELDPSGVIRAKLQAVSAPVAENEVSPAARRTAPAATAPPSAAPRAPQAAPALAPTSTTAAAEPRGSRVWVPLGWGLTAAGVAGGGVTTWLAISAAGLDTDAADTSRSISDRVDLQHRADARRRAALIVGIGSGAAIVLGVVTLVLPARADARSGRTAWNLGITGNGVAVFGQF